MTDPSRDPEMQALLSAYAAGTLTPEEQTRLFEKALENQALFDALADEESVRAALESPLVRKTLLRALEESKPSPGRAHSPSRWLWIGLAASIVLGVSSIYLWTSQPQPVPAPVEVAQATLPPPAPIDQPVPPAKPAAPPAPSRNEQPKPLPAAPAEAESADAIPVPAPAVSSLAAGASRAREERTVAKMADAAIPTFATISGNTLTLNPVVSGYIYAFLIDGERIQPIAIPNPVTPSSARTYPLAEHSPQAEVWVFRSPFADPALDRAASTRDLALPDRPWTKLKTN